jgi:hypothetical protein
VSCRKKRELDLATFESLCRRNVPEILVFLCPTQIDRLLFTRSFVSRGASFYSRSATSDCVALSFIGRSRCPSACGGGPYVIIYYMAAQAQVELATFWVTDILISDFRGRRRPSHHPCRAASSSTKNHVLC